MDLVLQAAGLAVLAGGLAVAVAVVHLAAADSGKTSHPLVARMPPEDYLVSRTTLQHLDRWISDSHVLMVRPPHAVYV